MMRTQIQLPNELYQRARRFAAEREMSLAEVTRRGLEMLLDRYAPGRPEPASWSLPQVDGGGVKVALTDFRDLAADDEASRGRAGS